MALIDCEVYEILIEIRSREASIKDESTHEKAELPFYGSDYASNQSFPNWDSFSPKNNFYKPWTNTT